MSPLVVSNYAIAIQKTSSTITLLGSLAKEQQDAIAEKGQAVLDACSLYPTSSLAELYDPLTMPSKVSKSSF